MLPSNKITIEMFPAGNGDAILLTYDDYILLIDGGYTSTYRDHLKKRLIELNQQGRRINTFVVTHIDADHISGAISFLKENGPFSSPNIIGIDDIWYNSYRHLQFQEKSTGILNQKPNININGGLESKEADNPEALVSFRQGSSFGKQILKYQYPWNKKFNENAVTSINNQRISISPRIKMTILGPDQEALNNLSEKWYKNLKKRYQGEINEDAFFDDAFELLVEEIRQSEEETRVTSSPERLVSDSGNWVKDYTLPWGDEDNSATNGSSISFLLHCGDKDLLFLGDSIPSHMTDAIKKIDNYNGKSLTVNLVKVAHHGAIYNNSPELIKMIQAQYFLFSSNGVRHDHPHLSTIASILKSHKDYPDKYLVFNYKQKERLSIIDSNPQIMNEYKFKAIWPFEDDNENEKDGYIRIEL
jgi:ribonuclease BN (tRNA processing enzyme)